MSHSLEQVAGELTRCNKCGFCTSVCPTFQVTGLETQVTRGRISLLQDVLAGTLTLAEASISFDSCLLCEACMSVCAPKVDISKVISAARADLRRSRRPPWTKRLVLRGLLPRPDALRWVVALGAIAERLGLRRLAERLGLLGSGATRASRVTPPLSLTGARRLIGRPPRPAGQPRARVAYYVTCAKDALFAEAARATVDVLVANGVEVVLPEVSCCGLPHHSAGDLEGTTRQARRNLAALRDLEVDAILVDDGSCGAHLRHLPELLAGQPEASAAAAVAAKIQDLAVFLERLGPAPMREVRARVTWMDSCSFKHGLRLGSLPGDDPRLPPSLAVRRLLSRIPGVVQVQAPESTQCCGGAGAIMIEQPALSDLLLEAKLDDLSRGTPDIIVAGSPSCVMQLRRGARERSSPIRVLYLSELLAMAYRSPDRGGGAA